MPNGSVLASPNRCPGPDALKGKHERSLYGNQIDQVQKEDQDQDCP